MPNREELTKVVSEAIELFSTNKAFAKIETEKLTLKDYHSILMMIFHQTLSTAETFSLAGVNCLSKFQPAKEYLFHHANEEKSHWRWIIDDLKNTGYEGEDPRNLFPKPSCQAYIAFNFYTALRMPIARLAIAVVLEGIGAKYGKHYGSKMCSVLNLVPNQLTFFLNHGDSDVGHTEELWEIIDKSSLDEDEWKWMCHAAKTAGILYKNMYEEALS